MSRVKNQLQSTVYVEPVRKEKNHNDLIVKRTSSLRSDGMESVTGKALGEEAGIS